MTESLQEIGLRCNTDKATEHSYLPWYENEFRYLRNRSISLLEVGVRYGASLRMWREWFREGRIVGLDIDDRSLWGAEEGFDVRVGDSRSPDTFRFWPAQSFDIIIDDGSHDPDDQRLTLVNLWPLLRVGGAYYIEDVAPPPYRFVAPAAVLVSSNSWTIYRGGRTPDDTIIKLVKEDKTRG